MQKNAIDALSREIESRIERLEAHRMDPIDVTGNHAEEFNQAKSKLIGSAVLGELYSLRGFIDKLEK